MLVPRTVQIVLLFEPNATARFEVAVALTPEGPGTKDLIAQRVECDGLGFKHR